MRTIYAPRWSYLHGFHAAGHGSVVDLVLRTLVRAAVYRVIWHLPLGLVVLVGMAAAVLLARRLSARPRRSTSGRR